MGKAWTHDAERVMPSLPRAALDTHAHTLAPATDPLPPIETTHSDTDTHTHAPATAPFPYIETAHTDADTDADADTQHILIQYISYAHADTHKNTLTHRYMLTPTHTHTSTHRRHPRAGTHTCRHILAC